MPQLSCNYVGAIFFIMEIWKDIPNYEGIYQASDLGRIKSFRKNKVKILKQLENTRGYFYG